MLSLSMALPPRSSAEDGPGGPPGLGLAAENRVLRQIAGGAPLSGVLGELLSALEAQHPGLPVWVLLIDGEHRFRIGARSGRLAGLASMVEGLAVGPGAGWCGAAAQGAERVLAWDLGGDPRWGDLGERAASLGLRSCLSVPVLSAPGASGRGDVLGTVAIFAGEADPGRDALAATLADLVSLAIDCDASERVAVRTALEQSEHALRRAQTLTRIGNWSFDRFSRRWAASDEFWRICGMSPGHHGASEQFEIVHPDDRERVAALYAAACEGHPGAIEHRILVGRETHWLDVRTEPIRSASGEVVVISGTSQDITARKELEAQLRQTTKLEAIGRLAGGIAHDFNNLLTVINGLSAELAGQLPQGSSERDDVLAILDAGERAAALTRQLLAFSRRTIVEPSTLDLNDRIAQLSAMLRRIIGENISLTTSLSPVAAKVFADPSQIDQTIINLAVNARDAMPHGGKLTIATRNIERPGGAGGPPGPQVELSIEDTGTGMSDEVKARLFEPFFTTKGVGRGTGLGLATIYGIVQQAGGQISVDSAPGRGTTFTLLLPAARASLAPPPRREDTLPRGTGAILVVEDQDPVRELVCRVLARCGYTVVEASSGDQALALLDREPRVIDLLLTDVVMPGMGGPELAGRFRALRPSARVIFMSGHSDDESLRQRVGAAEVHFLQKPFTPAQLAGKVSQVLTEK
jgi:PAS domain S-box-containing protein